MDWITDPQIWIAFVTLTVLEVVLGIDNIVFLSILAGKLPKAQQAKGRRVGLALAMVTRILLLLSLSWLAKLQSTLFQILEHPFSGRDLVLICGGLFLMYKSTHEIHQKLEGTPDVADLKARPTFAAVIVQILVIDVVFSLDSVITAVGMVDQVGVMIAAIVAAVGLMLVAAKSISDFVETHPTVKMLALAFLMMIGVALVADGLGQHIPKGYIYFSMAFSVLVEFLNLRVAKRGHKVKLNREYDTT